MVFLIFHNSDEMTSFLRRKLKPKLVDKIDVCVMERFSINRALFTAEHSVTRSIPKPEFGPRAYVGIGDKNTGILAKLAAFYIRGAYLIPRFLRTDADATRPPDQLGKGLRLFAKVFYSQRQAHTYIPIHSNPAYLPHLSTYHQLIERLNPRIIISIHGMHIKRKFDLLLGFGHDYETIGGKKHAFRFKHEFIAYLDDIFRQLGLRNRLQIAISTWLLAGSQNYTLTRHIIEHNRKAQSQRVGLQAEFNWRGRVVKADGAIPSVTYQLVVQALGDFILRWAAQQS